jgi:general secretion pathway protein C
MLERLKQRFKKSDSTATTLSQPSFATTGRGGLSVNSLSKLSDRLTTIGRGENIKRISFWICFVLSAWLLADLFALLAEKYLPSPPISSLAGRQRGASGMVSPFDYEVIVTRNLFSSKAPKKPEGNEIDLDAEPVPTTLPYQLIGTIIFENPARSMATIQDKNESKVYPVRMGDEIEDKIQIYSVEPRKVVFINHAARRKEYIDIPEDPIKITMGTTAAKPAINAGVTEVEENKFVVKRDEINSQLSNFSQLLTQALAKPEMRGGQMIGFRITQIQPGSFFSKILKDNDVLTSVNGERITDAAKALSLMDQLKKNHLNSVEIGVERDGKAILQNYDIK